MMTFKKFILFLLVAGYSVVRGKANRIPKKINKVLVIQMAKLGDMVCTTPVFRALKKTHPEWHLSVMGSSINREVLEGNTDIDEYLVFDGITSVCRKIRCGTFDVAIVTDPDVVSAALCYLAGVSYVVVPRVVGGYSCFESFCYREIRRVAGLMVMDLRIGHYVPGEYVRLLEALGIYENDTRKHLSYSQQAAHKVKEMFGGYTGVRVGISPSAGNKIKNWGASKFAQLANDLSLRFGVQVVIFGGERDVAEVDEMRKGLSASTKYLDLSQKLSIDELKAAISSVDLFVAVDTGPVYIAEAFSIATVDIVGPVDEREQPPRGRQNLLVIPPGERVPEIHIMNSREYNVVELKRQIESISVEAVLNACATLLS